MSKEETHPEGYNFTEEELVELRKYAHTKRLLLSKHPECVDHQAVLAFEQHMDRRLSEIAWNRYKKDKGIE